MNSQAKQVASVGGIVALIMAIWPLVQWWFTPAAEPNVVAAFQWSALPTWLFGGGGVLALLWSFLGKKAPPDVSSVIAMVMEAMKDGKLDAADIALLLSKVDKNLILQVLNMLGIKIALPTDPLFPVNPVNPVTPVVPLAGDDAIIQQILGLAAQLKMLTAAGFPQSVDIVLPGGKQRVIAKIEDIASVK